jgi:predicted double-glycine peptidase
MQLLGFLYGVLFPFLFHWYSHIIVYSPLFCEHVNWNSSHLAMSRNDWIAYQIRYKWPKRFYSRGRPVRLVYVYKSRALNLKRIIRVI